MCENIEKKNLTLALTLMIILASPTLWAHINIPVALNVVAHRSSNCGLLSPQQFSLLTISIQKVIRTRGHPSRAQPSAHESATLFNRWKHDDLNCSQHNCCEARAKCMTIWDRDIYFIGIYYSTQKNIEMTILLELVGAYWPLSVATARALLAIIGHC